MTRTSLRRCASLVVAANGQEGFPSVALADIEPRTGRLINGPSSQRDAGSVGMVFVAPGDVLFGKLRPYLRKWLLVREPMLASSELLAIRPSADVDSRWLSYFVASQPFGDWAVATSDGAKMPRTSWEQLSQLGVDLPSLGSQRAIADFLDAETARIDALIAKKRRMIELLDERTSAFVEQTLLGLREEPRAIPTFTYGCRAEWPETTLRHAGVDVQTGPFGSQLQANEYEKDGWPVLNPVNLRSGKIEPTAGVTIADSKQVELERHQVRPGDVLLARRGELGRAALVTGAQAGWICGTGLLRLRSEADRVLPRYLTFFLGLRPIRQYFALSSVGSTMDNLSEEQVRAMPLLLPPLDVQRRLVTECGKRLVMRDQLTGAMERQLNLLTEHRQALITSAVTGQAGIPGAA